MQEVELPQNKQFALENYDGKNYNTIVLRQYLLSTRSSGTLNIDKNEMFAVDLLLGKISPTSVFISSSKS